MVRVYFLGFVEYVIYLIGDTFGMQSKCDSTGVSFITEVDHQLNYFILN